MIKYLEVPDFHFDPANIETAKKKAEAVYSAAVRNNINFIALPGDLFNRPIIATDKGGYNEIRNIVKRWLSVCPVYAIEGTPSHDGKGCYNPLEDLGLVLLQPGKMYEYKKPKSVTDDPDCILFGVPELNKRTIQAKLGLSAEQANAETVNQFNRYVAEFIAPRRAGKKNIPAICLLHGVVSDARQINTDDIIVKSSDIVIHTEDLEIADLDRWSLGHIHKPWESEKTSAGYAGSSSLTWGETDFLPAMNLVTIGNETTIQRIPYGTPMRKKIYTPLDSYDPNIAYWLYTDDATARRPDGHPLSKITYRETRKEAVRITKEQAAGVKGLSDLFKLIDPDVTPQVIEKVKTLEKQTHKEGALPVKIELLSVEVRGCVFFGGKTVNLDLEKYPNSMIHIAGDNGSGKSSLLSFCSPYPVVIGKPTKSGRTSAIKDFFNQPESMIKKEFRVNDQTHTHIITINGAHTKSPKTECYLSVDGVPVLDGATFDNMLNECYKMYGPFSDYLLTSFYVQPLQGQDTSCLMSASMTDIRDLVQNIAGIDRQEEKRIALDKVKAIEADIQDKVNWIKGAEEFAVDINSLERQIAELRLSITEQERKLSFVQERWVMVKKELDELQKNKMTNDMEKTRQHKDKQKEIEYQSRVEACRADIERLESLAAKLEDNRRMLAEHERNDNRRKEYDALLNDYRTAHNERERAAVKYESEKRNCEIDIKNYENEIAALSKACPNCGWIDPQRAETIKIKQSEKESLEDRLKRLIEPASLGISAPTEPDYTPIAKSIHLIRAEIETGISAEAAIKEKKASNESLLKEINILKHQTYNIDASIDGQLEKAIESHNYLQSQYVNLREEIKVNQSRIENKQTLIENERINRQKINQTKADVKTLSCNLEDWKYISIMLQPAKIPALELEIDLDSIDAEATRIIEPFLDGRYTFETETQSQGKSGVVDKFDIKIYDAETGNARSFIEHSPGQKAFFSDAYVKALIAKRNSKSQLSYSPVILDEADGPIQPERIADYYEMQKRYWKSDSRILVVSHTPVSHEYIENKIDIEEIKA